MDPQNLSLLRCKVFFAESFWIAYLRFFVRVNDAMSVNDDVVPHPVYTANGVLCVTLY